MYLQPDLCLIYERTGVQRHLYILDTAFVIAFDLLLCPQWELA